MSPGVGRLDCAVSAPGLAAGTLMPSPIQQEVLSGCGILSGGDLVRAVKNSRGSVPPGWVVGGLLSWPPVWGYGG